MRRLEAAFLRAVKRANAVAANVLTMLTPLTTWQYRARCQPPHLCVSPAFFIRHWPFAFPSSGGSDPLGSRLTQIILICYFNLVGQATRLRRRHRRPAADGRAVSFPSGQRPGKARFGRGQICVRSPPCLWFPGNADWWRTGPTAAPPGYGSRADGARTPALPPACPNPGWRKTPAASCSRSTSFPLPLRSRLPQSPHQSPHRRD